MAKANITQYSSTPSSNTDINNINIDENCPASGLNNAIRELMAHLKNVDTGSQALTALSVTGDLTVDTSTLVVDSANNRVGIGTSSPATKLEVSDLTTTCSITIRSDRAGAGNLQFADQDDVNVGYISYQHNNDRMVFRAGDNQQVYIDGAGCMMLGTFNRGSAGNGDLVVNGGVYLGGTGSANYLDDYEEGSWTPNGNWSVGAGYYVKVGSVVHISIDVVADGTGGTASITNLPFSCNTTVGSGLYTSNVTYASGRTAPVVVIAGNSVIFRVVGSGVQFSSMPINANGSASASFTYRTTS